LIEKPLDLNGSYSLVFTEQMSNQDVLMVFAPNKGEPDITKYVYYQFDIAGNLKNRVEFKSPASALLISAAYERDGNIYFFGTSKKSTNSFIEVFNQYASIFNPGGNGTKGKNGNNMLDVKWRESLREEMDFFHLLKFSGIQLMFATTTSVAESLSKFKTAPGDQKATAYDGKKFFIENFFITSSGDYLVAGQLINNVSLGISVPYDICRDIICFQFDKVGNFKAQYGISKLKSVQSYTESMNMYQAFYPSSNSTDLYWELMEPEGYEGGALMSPDFGRSAARSPLRSFVGGSGMITSGVPNSGISYLTYFPRFVKINLSNTSLGEVNVLGNQKYFLRQGGIFDKIENSITYIGHDKKRENLWIGKMLLK